MRKENIDYMITLACGIQLAGAKGMDFTAFDAGRIDEYARQAKTLQMYRFRLR